MTGLVVDPVGAAAVVLAPTVALSPTVTLPLPACVDDCVRSVFRSLSRPSALELDAGEEELPLSLLMTLGK